MSSCQLHVPEDALQELLDAEEAAYPLLALAAPPGPKPFRIIPCSEWGARNPRRPIQIAPGVPNDGIFHHTYGLARAPSYAAGAAYARAIQNYHMDSNGWYDSGHSFLVTRGGYIFEGRHRSLEALMQGRCPYSAHCPGHNDEFGIEHEHKGTGTLTPIQREATIWLWTLICTKTRTRPPSIWPHGKFVSTSCPAELTPLIPGIRSDVQGALEPPIPRYVYDLSLRRGNGVVERFTNVKYPGKKLHEYGIVAHDVVEFWGRRKRV